MDRKGPEHHYDENESPENGRSIFWQQGEVAPDHVKNNDGFHGEGRPYRSQPSPVEDDMDRYRDMPLDGHSPDEGGNQFRTDKGILESVLSNTKDEEDLEQLDEATEPKGLGEFDPVKDNDWPPGEITTRPARDEMLGSVRHAEFNQDNEIWNEIIDKFEGAEKLSEEETSAGKVAAAPWLENDGRDSNVPTEHLGWDLVDVVEPSKEYTEAANKYSMPLPRGITDNLHDALIKLNVWVENPEENGKLRPYEQYWSVIRPKINEDSIIQIGVENSHMADIINHIARTDDISPLNKKSNFEKSSLGPLAPLLGLVAPALEAIGLGAGAAGAAGAGAGAAGAATGLSRLIPSAAGIMKGALGKGGVKGAIPSAIGAGAGNTMTSTPETSEIPEPANPITQGGMTSLYMSKSSTYGDHFDHPSTVSERKEDVEPGKIFPDTRRQTVDGPLGDQEWQRDYMDVNEIGQSRDIRGDDYEKQNLKRTQSKEDGEPDHDLSDAFKQFVDNIEDIMYFVFSEESGEDDPKVKSVHNAFESIIPNYLELAVNPEENEIFSALENLISTDKQKEKKHSVAEFGPKGMVPRDGAPLMPDPTLAPEQPQPNSIDPSTRGIDPQTAPAQAAGAAPGWDNQTSPNLINKAQPMTPQEQQQTQQQAQLNKQKQQQTQQQIMQLNQKRRASDTQGPHTDEQQAAVAELLLEQGREDEIPLMLQSPADYDEELAEIQNKDPMLGEAPEDAMPEGMPPAGGMPPEGPQPPGVPAGGMPPMPNEGMPTGISPMGAPTPGDLNPAGAGALQPPAMQALGSNVINEMLNVAFKYGADSVAGKCPKCDSHTTKMVQQDGKSKCHTCAHEWQDEAFQKSDGDSSHATTTSSFYAAIDSFEEGDYEDELEIDDSSHTWTDENGEPLQEGQEYEIYAHNYEIPDVGRVVEIKPNAVVYEIESDGGLRTTIEIDRQEADINGYRFSPTVGGGDENFDRDSFGAEDKIAPEPGQTTDLATPHREIGAAVKESIARFYMCPVADCPNNQGGGDYEPGICSIHNVELVPAGQERSAHKTAGKHYTPMEQRELIDEYGEARNADKLNLEGTHYADVEDDYFLFGC